MPYKDLEVRKLKQAGYSKTHYKKNKKEVIRKINVRKKAHKDWFAEFKSTLSCTVCGEDRPATLDFHHVTSVNTNKKVHKLVSDGHTRIRIQKEIEKCVVLCSNCHRIHHEKERKNKRKLVATSLK
jgi:phage FluMu gp28-like protein